VGPNNDNYICLSKTYGKACPICEEMQRLQQNENADDKLIASLRPKRRVIYNVIDLLSEDQKIQIFECSHFWFEKELLEEAQTGEDTVIFADLEEGATIGFRGSPGSYEGSEYFQPKNFKFIEREKYDESILEEAYSLDEFLVVPTYDEIKNVFYGIDVDAEDESISDEENNDQVLTNSTIRKRKTVEIEEETKNDKTNNETCPHSHKFAYDCDTKPECDDCAKWELCDNANGNM